MFSDPIQNVLEFGFIPGDTVVDFGAGAGHYSHVLSQTVGSEGKVIAVDIQKEMLARLKNEARKFGKDNIEVVWSDVEKQNGTNLRDGMSAGAVLSNILSMVEDKAGTIREAKRVIRPNGRICVVEWTNKISRDRMKELFTEAGLKFERVFEAGSHHYGMTFRK